jgi:hypothetical protein
VVLTVSLYVEDALCAKFALQLALAFIVTVAVAAVPALEQSPPQPVNL